VRYALGDRLPVLEGTAHYIADGARLIGQVRLKQESSVWFNAVLRGDNDWIEVGERSNVQDGCVLHTDTGFPLTIGRGVTVGHNAMLHGCAIADNSLIGIGSTILNGAVIGSHCIVGAHALVTEDKTFAEGTLILGAPARAIRELTAAEISMIHEAADHYVETAARYRGELERVESAGSGL
jgi:carbonic anhydrase/acetyltransferase-like protein (isoleucine patch superfamily)